jgi:hypothetical protein
LSLLWLLLSSCHFGYKFHTWLKTCNIWVFEFGLSHSTC